MKFAANASEPWHAPMAWADPLSEASDGERIDLAGAWLHSLGGDPRRAPSIVRLVRRFVCDSFAAIVADTLVVQGVPVTANSVARHASRLSDDERRDIRAARGQRIIDLDPDGTRWLIENGAEVPSLRSITESLGWGKVSTQGALTILRKEHPHLRQVDLDVY